MKKILISAFSCLPNRGSEPGVGWNWSLLAAEEGFEVTVLTRTKCKDKIEAAIPTNLKKSLEFIYCDSSTRLRELSIYLEYMDWQWKSYQFAKKYVRKRHFDYVWFLTFGNIFLPMYMDKLNIPFVWGPIGGGEVVPKQFWKEWPIKQKIPHIVKEILIKTVKFNPWIKRPASNAKVIITRTEDTKHLFPKGIQNKVAVNLETVLDTENFMNNSGLNEKPKENSTLSLVYTGRLTAFKNVGLLIRAFQINKEKLPSLKLNIIGDGEQKQDLEEYVKRNKIQDVIFYGGLEREKTLQIVSEADIFVFPSLREGASWSLLEAMSLKKPIVCFSVNGIKETTDSNCALRIQIHDNDNFIILTQKFADAIWEICNLTDEERVKMGEAGYKRLYNYFSFERGKKLLHEWLE